MSAALRVAAAVACDSVLGEPEAGDSPCEVSLLARLGEVLQEFEAIVGELNGLHAAGHFICGSVLGGSSGGGPLDARLVEVPR